MSWLFMHREVVARGTLWRFVFLRTPFGGVRLHHIREPDPDPDPHDHPWSFVSLVLWGRYVEHRAKFDEGRTESELGRVTARVCWWSLFGASSHVVRWLNWKRAHQLHRIVRVNRGGAWTLVFHGPCRRKWGFLTRQGWQYWREYLGVAS